MNPSKDADWNAVGVSFQALLYRSRRLGRLSDVSYRNAMVRISEWGWLRDEPGLVTIIEQPSLLPKAVELLAEAGIDEGDLLAQCRVPAELFRRVIARFPEDRIPRPITSTVLSWSIPVPPSLASTSSLLVCACSVTLPLAGKSFPLIRDLPGDTP